MQILEMLAPLGSNCRSGRQRLGFRGITVHNTSNYSNGAGALNHAKYLQNSGKDNYVSWHYVVDKDYAVRCIPENEIAWCAGDGLGDGNGKTINIEICDNADGDIRQATDNAVELCANILKRYGIDNVNGHLFQHNDWTGKDCPYDIRRGNPYDWNTFVNKVQEKLGNVGPDQVLTVGSKVIFNGVFKVDELVLPNGKYPNGAVGCYATCYGSPVGVNDWIPSGPLATCNADGSGVNYKGILKKGGHWKSDTIFTVKSVQLPNSHAKNGVAMLEADGVNFFVDCGPLYEVSDR